MRRSVKRLWTGLVLHTVVLGVWGVFISARVLMPRFRNAVKGFEATYQFRFAASARRLVISKGRIKTHGGACESPDYEIEFIDLPGALRHMFGDSNDVMGLVIENKIDQKGNVYYLFQFGYLFGLIEHWLRELTHKIHPRRRAAEDAGRA